MSHPTKDPQPQTAPPTWVFWSALWIVYLVWGSTYLAIRVTVETIPPLASAAVRFLVAGAAMYAFLLARRGWSGIRVEPRQLGASALIGTALLLGGNGIVSVAEQYVPSAVTALIIASVPLWVIVLRLVTRDAIARGTIAAVVLGFAGVALLVLPEASAGGADGLGYMLLVAASVSWASGSFLSSVVPLPRDPFTSTALQMLSGGAVIAVAAAIRGEFSGIDVSEFSGASIAGLIYLIVAGSLLAFTAYTWLLRNGPISKVSTYAYVNPVVAVILGWLILDEPVTASILAGAALVVLSVAFIVRIESRPRRRAAPEPGTAAAPVAAEN